MENFEKILELLQKQTLTEEEKLSLEQLTNSDEELKSFLNVYKTINSSLSASGHIPIDLISSFILFEKGDESESESEYRLVTILKDKIKFHLAQCSICKDEYNSLLNEYSEIKEHVSASIGQESQPSVKKNSLSFYSFFKSNSTFRYAFATLSVLIIGYFGLFFISSSVTPDYKKNIFSQGEDEYYTTRGRTSVLFQQGLNSIENGDYELAIKFLNEDILENKNDKSIFYSYYIIGITHLKAAESDFIGLFKSFDKQDIELAISNLRESIDKNDSGDYENLKLDSYYYIGRAYLLIDDNDSARSSFQKVIDGKGRFAIDSKNLIGQMEKN